MSIVQLYFSTDLLNDEPWHASIAPAGSTAVAVQGPVYSATLTGSFVVDDPAGTPPAIRGVVDGLTQTKNGATQLQVSGLLQDAHGLQQVLDTATNRPMVYSYLLRGDDTLQGSAEHDLLAGFAGNDAIDGGGGIDGAYYTGMRSGYAFSRTASGWQVQDRSGADGTDSLTQVERLSFEDVSVALDLDGNAGVVARILGAVYGKDAIASTEFAGIGLRLLDTGTSAPTLMQMALDNRLGTQHDGAAVVNLLYTNIVGTAPAPAQLSLFRGWLDNGSHTEATLGLYAADTGENAANIDLIGLSSSGLAFV